MRRIQTQKRKRANHALPNGSRSQSSGFVARAYWGLLSGKFDLKNAGPAGARRMTFDFPPVEQERAKTVLKVMREVAAAMNISIARCALAWLLTRPYVTIVIVGAKTHNQLFDNLASSNVQFSPEHIAMTFKTKRRLSMISCCPQNNRKKTAEWLTGPPFIRSPPWRNGPAIILLLFMGAGCHRKPPAAPPPPPAVEVMTVKQRDTPIYREWIGTLDGLVHAHIHPQVTGYLLARNYEEGSLVKKDDLMFEIDPRPFQAALDQALAKLGKAELDVKRFKPLAKENAISQQELDNAIQAQLGDKAVVDQAKLNLEFTKVTSPINGLSGLAIAQIGDLVGPNTEELTTVSTVDPIKVYFMVSEQEYLDFMRRYMEQMARPEDFQTSRLELILANGEVYTQKGRFYAADNQMDARTGTLRIAALFPNPGNVLLPGQFARVRITQMQKGALVIPQRAIMELQGNYQVAVVDKGNKAHIRPVTVGERTGSLWIIEKGLKAGERVVVEGVQKVGEGTQVKPTLFSETPATNLAPIPSTGAR